MSSYVIGISGASGAIYGVTLLEYLLNEGHQVYLILSASARVIIRTELGREWGHNFSETLKILNKNYPDRQLIYCDENDMTAAVASGSVQTKGMVVAPCSMKTLAGIAHGFSSNLIGRASDVTLKERRPLILIPRETPLHAVHLENMLKVTQLGATLLPAMPAFYNHPESINDLVLFIVARALDLMGLEHNLSRRWKAS